MYHPLVHNAIARRRDAGAKAALFSMLAQPARGDRSVVKGLLPQWSALGQTFSRRIQPLPPGVTKTTFPSARFVKLWRQDTGALVDERPILALTGRMGPKSGRFLGVLVTGLTLGWPVRWDCSEAAFASARERRRISRGAARNPLTRARAC
jgi:hypothetical protein